MTDQQKKNYFLIYGEVIYVNIDKPDNVKAANLNGVLISDTEYVSSTNLGEAQATLQQALHMRVDANTIDVKDVLIKSLSPLGSMTINEFAGSDVLAEARKAVEAANAATKQ